MTSCLLVLELTPDFAVENLLSEGVTENLIVNDENSWDQKGDILREELGIFFNEFRIIFDLLVWWNVHDQLNRHLFNLVSTLGVLTLRQKLRIHLKINGGVLSAMFPHNFRNILGSHLEFQIVVISKIDLSFDMTLSIIFFLIKNDVTLCSQF